VGSLTSPVKRANIQQSGVSIAEYLLLRSDLQLLDLGSIYRVLVGVPTKHIG
jgi:hypothetical protein